MPRLYYVDMLPYHWIVDLDDRTPTTGYAPYIAVASTLLRTCSTVHLSGAALRPLLVKLPPNEEAAIIAAARAHV